MSERTPVWIGIDGGSTYSFGVAVDRSGEVLAASSAGSLDFFGSDLPDARRNLQDLIKSLEVQLPVQNVFERIVIGSQSVMIEGAPEFKEQLCKGIVPMAETRLVGHSFITFQGANLGQPALIIFSGTGSSVLAQNEAGETFQMGGWGHLLADEGSAFWIAVESIKAAIAATEGRGRDTALVVEICEWFGVKDLADIVPLVYKDSGPKDRVGVLAEHLAKTLGGEDKVFSDILWSGAEALADLTLACLRLVPFAESPIPLYLVGGVLAKNDFIRSGLLSILKEHLEFEEREVKLPAILGAASLALADSGFDVSTEMAERMDRSYQEVRRSARRASPPKPS